MVLAAFPCSVDSVVLVAVESQELPLTMRMKMNCHDAPATCQAIPSILPMPLQATPSIPPMSLQATPSIPPVPL